MTEQKLAKGTNFTRFINGLTNTALHTLKNMVEKEIVKRETSTINIKINYKDYEAVINLLTINQIKIVK